MLSQLFVRSARFQQSISISCISIVCHTCIECRNIDNDDDSDTEHNPRIIVGEAAVKGEFKGIVRTSLKRRNSEQRKNKIFPFDCRSI